MLVLPIFVVWFDVCHAVRAMSSYKWDNLRHGLLLGLLEESASTFLPAISEMVHLDRGQERFALHQLTSLVDAERAMPRNDPPPAVVLTVVASFGLLSRLGERTEQGLQLSEICPPDGGVIHF